MGQPARFARRLDNYFSKEIIVLFGIIVINFAGRHAAPNTARSGVFVGISFNIAKLYMKIVSLWGAKCSCSTSRLTSDPVDDVYA